MKKFHIASIVVGLALLALLFWSIGVQALWHQLRLLGWGLVPLILIEGIAELLHTIGWRHCLSGPLRQLSFFQLFRIRMAGFSINYLTPTASLGGEVTKGTLLSNRHQGPEAATGVIIDKLSYALAQLLFAVGGSVFILLGIRLPDGVWAGLLGASALLGSGIIAFLLIQKYGKLGAIVRWLVARRIGGKPLANAARHLNAVDEALQTFYQEHRSGLPLSMLWHIVGMAIGIVQSWYFLNLLTDHASWLLAAAIWFLGTWLDLLSFALPLNIGVLEGSRVLIFQLLGFQAALGLTFGVMLRLEQLFWAGAGLLLYTGLLAEQRRKAPLPAGEAAGEGKP